MGRPKKYETDAERVAAFREKNKRVDLSVNPDLFETLEKIAVYFDVSKNEVVNSLIRTALTSGDVFKTGLYAYKRK